MSELTVELQISIFNAVESPPPKKNVTNMIRFVAYFSNLFSKTCSYWNMLSHYMKKSHTHEETLLAALKTRSYIFCSYSISVGKPKPLSQYMRTRQDECYERLRHSLVFGEILREKIFRRRKSKIKLFLLINLSEIFVNKLWSKQKISSFVLKKNWPKNREDPIELLEGLEIFLG